MCVSELLAGPSSPSQCFEEYDGAVELLQQ